MQNTIRDAVDELAGEQLDAEVTAAQAREYVTPVLFAEWLGDELAAHSMQTIFGEITEKISDEDLRTVLCALVLGYDAKAAEILRAALTHYVARDLAQQANTAMDNRRAFDAPAARGYVCDPLFFDRYQLAREHNAAIAVARVSR